MKRLVFLTVVLTVTAMTLTGCESASRFCLRNRGASCDPCAPPCAPSYEPCCGATNSSGIPMMEGTTMPLPPGSPTMIPGG